MGLYETVRAHGRIDIVLANAGVAEFAPLETITEEHFDKLFNIQFRRFSRRTLPLRLRA
jgi:NAD(P)-dependent dehydrogenase (short-subunit alcohol dehydrogenase family)